MMGFMGVFQRIKMPKVLNISQAKITQLCLIAILY